MPYIVGNDWRVRNENCTVGTYFDCHVLFRLVAHLNLGIVLVQLNRKKEAEERYERCSQLNGDGLKDPKTHENAKLSCLYNLGRLEADQGIYHQAIKTYHKAIERLNSHYPPHSLYNMLGTSNFQIL